MSNQLPDQISRRNLITMLRDTDALSVTQLRAIRDKYNLRIDVPAHNAAVAAAKNAMDERNVLYRLYNESAAKITATSQELLKLAEAAADTRVMEELKPGWITQEFIDKFNNDELKAILPKLNLPPERSLFSPRELDVLYAAPNYLRDGYTQEDYSRAQNLLVPAYNGDRHNGFRGREYSLGIEASQRLGNLACRAWRSGDIGSYFEVREYTAHVREDFVEIGCQTISKAEITRVAALMGWADFEKQTGPEIRPKHLPLEVGKTYVARNGDKVTVKTVPSATTVLSVLDGEGRELGMVFTATGRSSGEGGPDREFDIVGVHEDVTREDLFPLKEGSKVRLRDGSVAYVGPGWSNETVGVYAEPVEKRGEGTLLRDVWRVNGCGHKIMSPDRELPTDVVGWPLFPLEDGMHVVTRNGTEAWVFPGNRPERARLRRSNSPSAGLIAAVNRSDGRRYDETENAFDVVKLFEEDNSPVKLPLEHGQRVRLRDGREGTVFITSPDTGTAGIAFDDGTRTNTSEVYTSSGRPFSDGRESENDVVETLSHPFPLQKDDVVRLRDGAEVTIREVSVGGRATAQFYDGKGDNIYVWAENGCGGAQTNQYPYDVMTILKREPAPVKEEVTA